MQNSLMQRQKGVTLSGLLAWSVVLVLGAILGMKLIPAFAEYAAIKKNLVAIVSDSGLRDGPASEMKKSFDKRATIDDIKVVRGNDINVSKDGGQTVLNVSYAVKTPLVANVSLCIDFDASSSALKRSSAPAR